jgi:hypothetical protein
MEVWKYETAVNFSHIKSFPLQTTNYKLQTTNYKLQTTNRQHHHLISVIKIPGVR